MSFRSAQHGDPRFRMRGVAGSLGGSFFPTFLWVCGCVAIRRRVDEKIPSLLGKVFVLHEENCVGVSVSCYQHTFLTKTSVIVDLRKTKHYLHRLYDDGDPSTSCERVYRRSIPAQAHPRAFSPR